MKKNFLVFGTILLLTIGITSCGKKCVDCGDCPDEITLTDANGNDTASLEICEKDANSKDEYNEAVSLIEALGCECK